MKVHMAQSIKNEQSVICPIRAYDRFSYDRPNSTEIVIFSTLFL